MSRLRLLSLCLAASVVTLVAWGGDGKPEVRAEGYEPFIDTDGDLLPDALEWVALTNPHEVDTNFNGADDFLEVVEHRLPLSVNVPRPVDHAMRALVYGSTTPEGPREMYLALLLRFVGANIGAVQVLEPFIEVQEKLVPLTQLIGSTRSHLSTKLDGKGGLYVMFAMRLSSVYELRSLLPCTIGVRAVVDGRRYLTGSYLLESDLAETALVPVGAGNFALQPANAQDSFANPFWKRNKVCIMTLDVIGSSGNGNLCEVRTADCTVANGLVCGSTCTSAVGLMIFVPEGLSTITGGG